MNETIAVAGFLTRWNRNVGHDLSGSDSETLPLAGLLELAEPDDLARWRELAFGYSDPRGASWLRAAIAGRHRQIGPEDVVCCAGAQEAVACATAALLSPGDHAIVVLPIYQPSEQSVTRICAATGVPLEREGWRLDVDRIAAAIRPETKLVLTNFPNSPTGAALDDETLARLVQLCRRHGIWLVNDEVYWQTDDSDGHERRTAAADAYERGVSINGLSKGFGLPGLRVGWAACRDRDLLARMLQAKVLLSSCLSGASEVLAHVALRAERAITDRTRAIGRGNLVRLNVLVDRFPDLFALGATQNLAFAFPRYLGAGGADGFADRLAREAGILILPSTLWRSSLGPTASDHLRIGLGHARSAAALDQLQTSIPVRQAA